MKIKLELKILTREDFKKAEEKMKNAYFSQLIFSSFWVSYLRRLYFAVILPLTFESTSIEYDIFCFIEK